MSRCNEPINTEHCNYEQTPANQVLERGKIIKYTNALPLLKQA